MKASAVKLETVKRLLGYMLLEKRKLSVAGLLLLAASLADVSGPWLVQHFIDNHIVKDDYPVESLVGLALGYICLMCFAAWFQYGQAIRFHGAAVGVVRVLRKQLFGKILHQPLSAFDYVPTGELISRVTNDTESIYNFYVFVISAVLKNLVLITVMLIVMSQLSWRLTLVMLVLLPVVVIIMVVYQRKSTPAFRRTRDLLAGINSSLNETLQGMSLIQLMRQEKQFTAHFQTLNQRHLQSEVEILKLNGLLLRPLIDFLAGVALVALVALLGVSGTELIGVGLLYAFISYLGRVTEPLIELTQRLTLVQQALIASERIFEFMDAKQQAYGSDDRPISAGRLECQQVGFSYDERINVLSQIDVNLPHRGYLALVGHTGSGKSSLASLFMGFYPATQGEIRIDGRQIHSLSQHALREGIAMVPQDPHVLNDTIRENVTLGRPLDDDTIWRALDRVGLAAQVHQFAGGLDAVLGEGIAELSAGQKQLLSLARVFVARPKILILDEATANIDSGTERNILKSLATLRKEMSIVVIAHRLSTIVKADEILMLHKGRIIERGTHRELLSQEGKYEQMYRLQQASEQLNKFACKPNTEVA